MSLIIKPIHDQQPDFAAMVHGIDVSAGVSPEIAAQIEQAMDHYAVLVIPNQRINDEQQYAFSQHFGPMEQATGDAARPGERRLSMNINDISNLDKSGEVVKRDDRRRLFSLGNMLWHSDSSFKPTPSKYSLLSARIIPASGGNTEFADMRAAWDALAPDAQAEAMNLVCDHSQLYSRGLLGFDDWDEDERKQNAPVPQRLVRRHPNSKRLSLYLASHAGAIHGWPMPEARVYLRDLIEHATQPQFVYSHSWKQWDLVMWDNRVMMHRARRYDRKAVRDLHRTTVADSAPTLQQPL